MNILAISPYVFNTELTWYSVIMLIGALIAYGVSNYFYKKEPESKKCPDLLFNTFLIAFPAGLVGGRIWYVLSEWDYYMADPIRILKVWEGGLAIQGGVILGIAAGVWYATHKMRKSGMTLSITRLMDIVIPNILIAQVLGRWGNFFNREVYGACTTKENLWFLPSFILEQMAGEGFYYSGRSIGPIACEIGEYAQPLFLYEGILNFIGFILITFILRKWFKKRIDGTLSAFYLIWYGTIRVCLEGLRNEKFIMRWGSVSQSVVTSIAYIILGAAFIIYLYVKKYKRSKLVATPVIGEQVDLSENKEVEAVEKANDNMVKEELVTDNVEKTGEADVVKKKSTPKKTTSSSSKSKAKSTSNVTNKATSSTGKTGTTKTSTAKTPTSSKSNTKKNNKE